MQAQMPELDAHHDMMTCLAMDSPHERALVSGCRNGDKLIWDSRLLLLLDVRAAALNPGVPFLERRWYWRLDWVVCQLLSQTEV
jgi:hypothetical protein